MTTKPLKPSFLWTPARLSLLIIGLWLGMRLFTGLWLVALSPLRPIKPTEQNIPIWPPGPGWLDRAFVAPWLRWDANQFVTIVEHGYSASDGTAQFHPLYPWLAVPLFRMGLSALLSLLVISSASALLFLFTFYRLAALDLDGEGARTATLLLIFCPLAFILFAPYSESLFLWLSALCLWWARQRRWWLAGLAGGLAALTRQQGVFLLVPLAWEWWESAGRSLTAVRRGWHDLLAVGLIPLGLLAWMLYRGLFLADVQPDWSSLHGLIYSVVISPSASQVVPVQAFIWPWQAIWIAIKQLFSRPDFDLILNALLAVYFLLLLVWSWRGMRVSYRFYAIAIYLVSFSYYTGPIHPYMGLARHLLLAFPVFIGLGQAARRPWQRLALVAYGMFGIMFGLIGYAFEAWVP